MAILQIILSTVDMGLSTGGESYIQRIVDWTLDGVPQSDCILNVPQATTNIDAAQQLRNHLTANGKSWDTESLVNVIS